MCLFLSVKGFGYLSVFLWMCLFLCLSERGFGCL